MIALYSQGVRQILLKQAKTWDKTNQFLMILKSILVKYYNQPEKTQEFFNKIRPEIILLKIIRDFGNEQDFINTFKHSLKISNKYDDLSWIQEFIIKFFRYIGINCMDIFRIDYRYILNLDNFLNLKFNKNIKDIEPEIKKDFSIEKLLDDGNLSLKSIPDIIFLIHSEHLNYKTFYDYYIKKYDLSGLNYDNFNPIGVYNYEDEIEINGYKYRLDACILDNYNYQFGSHSTSGITCNGNRYVYNGWNKKTFDPSIEKNTNFSVSPCSLMKYDWNIKKDEGFCFNTVTCKLDFSKNMERRNACFSFNKGNKILVYVRVDNKSKDYEKLSLSIPSSLNLEDVSSVMKELTDVKNLTDYELKEKIRFLIENDKNRKQLEEIFNFLIKQYYNYNKKIKQSANS